MNKLASSKKYPWLLVLCYSLLGMTCPAAVTQYSMVVNELAASMGIPAQSALSADSFRAVMLVAAMFLSSFLYQKMGLRKTIALGLAFQIASQFFIPIAVNLKSLPLLFLFKGMQGLNSIAFPLYISTITLWISDHYRGLATAIFNGSFIAGGGLGAWITGRLIPVFGWQSSFFVMGSLCLVLAIPALLLTRDKENPLQTAQAHTRRSTGNVYGPILKNPTTWYLVIALIANTWVSQAINVDMSVYAQDIGYSYSAVGSLMLIISFVTVLSSVLAGGVSDRIALKLQSPVKSRCIIMAAGYLLAAVSAVLLPRCSGNFLLLSLMSSAMMFGVSWAAGVFWAIPSELFPSGENVAITAFCSSTSNIPNPIAPTVVGVLLGSRGYWNTGWMTCTFISALSLAASLLIFRKAKAR